MLLEIEGMQLEFELDTGAAVSIVSYTDYCRYFGHIPLSKSSRALHVYTGTPLKIAGEIHVKVKYTNQEYKLPLVLVKVDGDKGAPPLFGT